MDLSRKLAGLALEHPLMNAAGTVKTLGDVRSMAKTAVSAVLLGSITMDARGGHEGSVFVPQPDGAYALNSLGMPNPGLVETVAKLPDMIAIAHDENKPFIVSVAGFTPSEYGILADTMFENEVDMVELNLGCPNMWEKKGEKRQQHRIASFDPALIARILDDVEARVGEKARVSVKLSVFTDKVQLEAVAMTVSERPVVKAVVCSNTFPNALELQPNGSPVIDSPQVPDGLAGLSGPAMKPIALGQVRQFKQMFKGRDIQIIGVGGVSTGADLRDYLLAGATAVQCATAPLTRGGKVFSEILAKYVELA